jgi:DNA-directed RNA polymerase subunit RPC12/RpoP
MSKDIVFKCKKCGHNLFVGKTDKETLKKIMGMDCPNCGEEGYENWILSRMGNYEKECGKGKE